MGKRIQIQTDEPNKLAQLLSTRVAGLSKANADKLVKSGEVRVNGARTKTNVALAVGDTVTAFVPDKLINAVRAPVVYEDDCIVIFDKPKHTPFDALPEMYGAEIFAVHRLDTNTSGLIVFAKTLDAKTELERAFEARTVQKTYEAVVCPAPCDDCAICTAYTKMSGGVASVSAAPKDGYKTMTTEYRVSSRIGEAAILKVMPHTGRTHQIRAHLKFLGCPIVGDGKYGGMKFRGIDSQMLAAVGIEFSGLRDKLAYLNGKKFETASNFDTTFLR